jgi:hypothetical protein
MVREYRHLFLCKKAWHTFKGYAFSQLHKMNEKNPEGKRLALREKYGWDIKFGLHTVRLIYEIEQILQEGDIDLQRHKEHLKSIRRGEVKQQDVIDFFNIKEKELEKLYHESNLRHSPDWDALRKLLINCLEHHYGSLDKCLIIQKEKEVGKAEKVLEEIDILMDKYYNSL